MKLTPSETVALAPYIDRLHQDDLENILDQFRTIAHVARDKHMQGQTLRQPVPGDAEWIEWLTDLHAAGVIVSRMRDPHIADQDAWTYAGVYLGATQAIRVIYLPRSDGRCPALDELDAMEAARGDDPAAVW